MTTSAAVRPQQRAKWARYWHSLWLLTKRDLQVRYTTNALGYLWSILDPLLMAAIYFFVFVVIFHRGKLADESPYIVFLLSTMLPWVWFNGALNDCTRAFLKEAKLIRSTMIPRTIWVNRIVFSKGIEFLFSLPVFAFFVLIYQVPVQPGVAFFPLAIVLQAILTIGLGLIIAPLVVFFRDLERAVKLILRLLFYASPIVYSIESVPHTFRDVMDLNPLTGIFDLYRAGFFPGGPHLLPVAFAAVASVAIFWIGLWVFRKTERSVLKEI